ncbi:comm3 isoform X1 [Haematobia irritans]|uniref:comm3 isoform X1 n=1 Tax=Haematobia irritans TaxID=7368 RepID=UPI003F4FBEB0
MSDMQILTNLTTAVSNSTLANVTSTAASLINDTFDLDLLQNYTVLINKLEQLAVGVDPTFGNISVDHKEFEISLGSGGASVDLDLLGDPIAASRAGPPHITYAHGLDEAEYSRVVSDIWIGVILTLLIVSVIFFICVCFLYHKFQQWKNSYRTSNSETVEVCRNCPPNYEVESLPSYTIVSGLPTYDDAIEEFRKAGIILTPPMPIIKIFEAKDSKDIINIECGSGGVNEGDTISLNSISNNCTCGGGIGGNVGNNLASIPNNNNNNLLLPPIQTVNHAQSTQFIELTPDQLAHLSQKRLSLQIAFPQPGSQFRRNSRPRVDMRNHLLRSRASGTNNNGTAFEGLPQIHRTSSTFSLNNERHMTTHMQHRGSLY